MIGTKKDNSSTPLVKQYVVFDTGSSWMGITAKGCSSCKDVANPYDFNNSEGGKDLAYIIN